MKRWFVACLAFAAPFFAGAEAPAEAREAETIVFVPEAGMPRSWAGVGTVEYVVRHKLHTVRGVSRQVEIRAVADGSGLKVMGRAPVRSFDSGNSNRDAHVLEVVRAEKNPLVVLRGMAKGFQLPKGPGSFTVPLETEVQLAGVATPVHLTAHRRARLRRLEGEFRLRSPPFRPLDRAPQAPADPGRRRDLDTGRGAPGGRP